MNNEMSDKTVIIIILSTILIIFLIVFSTINPIREKQQMIEWRESSAISSTDIRM